MDAVLRDEVDMGFLLTGWLEANYPQNIPLFQLHELKTLNYQSEPYPFLTSTELVPAFGLSSAPSVPWSLQQRILNALTSLNATHKAAQSAGIATFTLAASYESTRKVGLHVGVIVQDGLGHGETHCHSPFQKAYEIIMCPDGFVKESEEAVEIGCKRRGLYCPKGLECVCRPCIPVLAVNVFPWQVVLGLCAALFAAGLLLTLGWRATLELSDMDMARKPSSLHRGWKV